MAALTNTTGRVVAMFGNDSGASPKGSRVGNLVFSVAMLRGGGTSLRGVPSGRSQGHWGSCLQKGLR